MKKAMLQVVAAALEIVALAFLLLALCIRFISGLPLALATAFDGLADAISKKLGDRP